MKKVSIDDVKLVLQRAELDAMKVAQIIDELNQELKAQVAQEPEKEKVKKQYVFIVNDPKGKIKQEFTGWIVQISEDDNPATALEKLHLGAFDFNRSVKGRRYPVKTVAEACEFGSAKIFKEQKIWIKTKEPVLVIPSNNKIPTAQELGGRR